MEGGSSGSGAGPERRMTRGSSEGVVGPGPLEEPVSEWVLEELDDPLPPALVEPPTEEELELLVHSEAWVNEAQELEGRCGALNKEVDKLLLGVVEKEASKEGSSSAMIRWMDCFESAITSVAEPEIVEVSNSKLCFGEGATVIDRWLGSRSEEAALRAAIRSVASRAYAEAQEKRRRGHGKGGTLGRPRSSPSVPTLIPQDAIPTVPQIEEEAVRVPEETTDPNVGGARVLAGTALGTSNPAGSDSGGAAKRRTRPRGSKQWRRGKEKGEGEVEIWSFNSWWRQC